MPHFTDYEGETAAVLEATKYLKDMYTMHVHKTLLTAFFIEFSSDLHKSTRQVSSSIAKLSSQVCWKEAEKLHSKQSSHVGLEGNEIADTSRRDLGFLRIARVAPSLANSAKLGSTLV